MNLKDVDSRLLENGILDIRGDVNGDMADYVRECLRILRSKGSPEIIVEISSNGGHVDIGLMIFDMLRLYPGKKIGKVVNFARSMAAVILQACDRRLCSKHSRIMIHHIYRGEVSLDVLRSKKRTQEVLESMEVSQGQIYEILCKRTEKTQATIKKVCTENRDMTAKEALKFRLIDKII